ncbi:MAG TPA: FlgD immunoglobulin-like domain containing protein, partial [Candidatus Eisenbacteria bacterium]
LALDASGAPVIAIGARTGGPFRLVSASVPGGAHPLDGDVAPGTGHALAAWPTPYRGGELNVSFVVPPHSSDADVRVVDLAGRHVRTLSHSRLEPGRRILGWDGRDDAGHAVPNGVYFLIGRSDDQTSRLKLAVLR